MIAQIDAELRAALLLTDLQTDTPAGEPSWNEMRIGRTVKTIFVFAAIPVDLYHEVAGAVEQLKGTPGVIAEQVTR